MLRILNEGSAYERFEVLEHYGKLAEDESDVLHLLAVLQDDKDPIVRHEAAAQLLKLETTKPSVTARVRERMCEALRGSIRNDPSVIVRHEAMEALAYIGNEENLSVLQSLIEDPNSDIQFTARIAYDMLRFRLQKNIAGSELGAAICAVSP
jgi:HEAT repeat protein